MSERASDDRAGQRRRYRILLCVEAVLLALGLAMCAWLPELVAAVKGSWLETPVKALFVALVMWHVVAIPVCFLYLIGRPVVMTLSPLFPSRHSRSFWRELRARPTLDADQFHGRFYEGSGIPKYIPARVRSILIAYIGEFGARMIPSDNLGLIDDELDFGPIITALEREFGVRMTNADVQGMDGTLGTLILWLHVRVSPEFR